MDFLDLLNGKFDKTLEGTWYIKKQMTPQTVGQPFDYEILEPNSRSYQMIIGNLAGSGNTLSIKTSDDYEWKEKTFVVLQDSKMYIIESIREDLGNVNKEAFRMLKDVVGIEYVLGLIEVDNPYGLK